MQKQVLIIHGGDSFEAYEEYLSFLKKFEIDFDRLKSKGWKETLADKLGASFEVIQPKMPNSMNARYSEWKIWLEKYFPILRDNLILVGHSQGGIFLAKYLSQNMFPKKISATFLIAAPYNMDSKESLVDFALTKNLKRFEDQGGEISLYHSEDDPIVPFSDLGRYEMDLPKAKVKTFKNRGHFQDEELPELVEDIRSI